MSEAEGQSLDLFQSSTLWKRLKGLWNHQIDQITTHNTVNSKMILKANIRFICHSIVRELNYFILAISSADDTIVKSPPFSGSKPGLVPGILNFKAKQL